MYATDNHLSVQRFGSSQVTHIHKRSEMIFPRNVSADSSIFRGIPVHVLYMHHAQYHPNLPVRSGS